MRIKLLLVISFLLFICSGCVAQKNFIETNPIDKVYKNSINVLDMELPLPEGEWKVVGRGLGYKSMFTEIFLVKTIGNNPHSIIEINRDSWHNTAHAGYIPNTYLKRENIHHVVVNKNKRSEARDGWVINHIRMGFNAKDTKPEKEAYKYLIDNKMIMPGNFIKSYHVFSGKYNKKKYLSYSIYINPEVDGFDPPKDAAWGSSDWHILKISNDPKKVAYIENLKKEGAVFHKKLREAFGD